MTNPHTTSALPIDSLVGLRIVTSEKGTTSLIELGGEWDLAEWERIHDVIWTALQRRPERLVLDLEEVEFVDSSAVAQIVALAKSCAEQDIHLVIIPGSRQVQRVFELCQLTTTLPFTTDIASVCGRDDTV